MKTPWWMSVVIIVAMLPVVAFPTMLNLLPSSETSPQLFVWLYPAYVIVSGIMAYICYPQRREVSWIIIVLMLLTHAALWWLLLHPSLMNVAP